MFESQIWLTDGLFLVSLSLLVGRSWSSHQVTDWGYWWPDLIGWLRLYRLNADSIFHSFFRDDLKRTIRAWWTFKFRTWTLMLRIWTLRRQKCTMKWSWLNCVPGFSCLCNYAALTLHCNSMIAIFEVFSWCCVPVNTQWFQTFKLQTSLPQTFKIFLVWWSGFKHHCIFCFLFKVYIQASCWAVFQL